MGLQVLANVSLAGDEHQQAIWFKFFPNEFFLLARVHSQETSDPLCMILYTCCDGKPGLVAKLCGDSGLPIVAGIIKTVASVGFEEDWFKLLLSRLCLEDIHFLLLFFKLCEGSASENNGNIDSGDDLFSSEQAFLLIRVVNFVTRGKSVLPTGSTSIDVMGYSLIILIVICAREGMGDLNNDSLDVVDMLHSHELIDILLSLLRHLEPPAIIRKTLKEGENQELNTCSSKLCPYKGFRKDMQCVTDDDNPYLKEWGIWSLRNLLEGNAENQQAEADLELQASVDMPELAKLVEVNQLNLRAKLVNIPGSYPKPDE
ncbi:hypothetical protein CRYUN_Cryun26dG0130700 [Craigia yunnanensis]